MMSDIWNITFSTEYRIISCCCLRSIQHFMSIAKSFNIYHFDLIASNVHSKVIYLINPQWAESVANPKLSYALCKKYCNDLTTLYFKCSIYECFNQ